MWRRSRCLDAPGEQLPPFSPEGAFLGLERLAEGFAGMRILETCDQHSVNKGAELPVVGGSVNGP